MSSSSELIAAQMQAAAINTENWEYISTALIEQKADVAYMDEQLALKANVEDLTLQQAYINNQLAAMGNGSPKGAFATLTALQAAYPTGASDPYVVSADGYLYGWFGSAWTPIVKYQSDGIADGSITAGKTNLFQKGKNLFDKDAAVFGNFVAYSNGALVANASYYASDYIEVDGNTVYTRNQNHQMAFYDSAKAYISGVNGSQTSLSVHTFTTPANAKYVRVTVSTSMLNSYQLELGGANTDYELFGYSLKDKYTRAQLDGSKVLAGSITVDKTNLFSKGKNLFDKDAVTPGKFVAYTNGNLADGTNYNATDYIEIEPNTVYTISQNHQWAFFDSSKAYISGNNGASTTFLPTSFTSPANARFIRATVSTTLLDVFQLEKGSSATTYEPFGYSIKDKYNKLTIINGKNIKDGTFDESKLSPSSKILVLGLSKNLFNKATVTTGYFVSWPNGTLQANVDYVASDYIPVTPSTAYYRNINNNNHTSFYNESKTFISGSQNTAQAFTTPAGCYFIRVSFKVADSLDGVQIEQGTSGTAFASFGYAIPSTLNGVPVSGGSSGNTTSQTSWSGKKGDGLGDSITAQNQYQPVVAAQLGLAKYSNHGISGTRVSGTGTDAMNNDARINALDADADLITFMGGTNDWANNVPLGSLGTTDVNTFYGALEVVAQKLTIRYPSKRVVFMTTPYGKFPNRAGWVDTYGLKNNIGLTTGDYAKCVQEVARIYGIPCADIHGNAGWNDFNITTFINNDGAYLHPNVAGSKRMAEVLVGKLKSIDPIA